MAGILWSPALTRSLLVRIRNPWHAAVDLLAVELRMGVTP
jgi:hypothetical protein